MHAGFCLGNLNERDHRRRWEGNIKMDFQEVEWVGMNWIDLAQNRIRCQAFVNAVMNLWVP